MRELMRAVNATQHSAVTQLPRQLQNGTNELGVEVPPLPFGPTEKNYFGADGGVETATAEQLAAAAEKRGSVYEGDDTPKPLYFFEPKRPSHEKEGEVGESHVATRPDPPLRNKASEVVDEATWKGQKAEEGQ